MNKELEGFKKSLDTMIGNQVDVIGMSLTRDTANLLASLLTPPKADEVCNLIENDIHGKAIYKNSQFYIDNEKVDDMLLGKLRPKTLIAYGRFYENEESKNE